MSAEVRECFKRGEVLHCLMVEIDHPAGFAYFWSGIGDIEFEGNTYHGYGKIGAISQILSTTEPEIIEVGLTASGVDPSMIAGLDDSVKNRPGAIYEAFLDRFYRVIDRTLLMEVECDYQVQRTAPDGKSDISIKAHGGLFFLRKRSAAKCSPAEARAQYDDETGFDLVHQQEDLVPSWRPA